MKNLTLPKLTSWLILKKKKTFGEKRYEDMKPGCFNIWNFLQSM